jgi:trans-aconitate methyltransferase
MIQNNFWKNKKDYPKQWLDPRRIYKDILTLLPLVSITNAKTVRDISCGLGNHGQAILAVFPELQFQFYDYNIYYVNELICKWESSNVYVSQLDISQPFDFTINSDFDYCLGSLHYIIDDGAIQYFLRKTADTLLIRVPCSMGQSKIEVDKYSKELKSNYRATYRTINKYVDMMKEKYNYVDFDFAFNKSIDSKYGTRQIYFLCQKIKNTSLESLAEWGLLQG